MFFGQYDYIIDSKGRLVIPSRMRKDLGNTVYLMKGYDGCLSLFKEEDFNLYLEKLKLLEFEKNKVRTHERLLLSSVDEIEIDKQGRILIPSKTLNLNKIEKNVTIVGTSDHIEIWNTSSWKKYLEENNSNFEKNAEALLKNEE